MFFFLALSAECVPWFSFFLAEVGGAVGSYETFFARRGMREVV